jgi:hypothetical protein
MSRTRTKPRPRSTSGCLEHGFGPKHPLGLLHARSSVPTAVPAILKTKPSLRQKQWVGTTSRGPTGGRVPSLGNLITVRTRRQQGGQIMHIMQGYQSTDLGT